MHFAVAYLLEHLGCDGDACLIDFVDSLWTDL